MMRKKLPPVLLTNARTLPGSIMGYRKRGEHAKADLAERILAETRQELARRGR
jgi:hypothetical protein